jgi:hypothetical protein
MFEKKIFHGDSYYTIVAAPKKPQAAAPEVAFTSIFSYTVRQVMI